jgi:plasmid stabilization system protein ParE
MTYSLSLRPRALAEIEAACDRYALVGHGDNFLAELESVFEAIQAMPLRFPIVYGTVHRALLRRYPFAVFFRVRPATEHVVVLAVFPQRDDVARWPAR